MKALLDRLRPATLRHKLLLSVAGVQAAFLGLFLAQTTLRQSQQLLDRQREHTTAMTRMLATSSAGWISARDLSGLQELVDTLLSSQDLVFAMVLDREGRVLAHTDRNRVGAFVRDLPTQARITFLHETPERVDLAVPAYMGDTLVGWARVGISPRQDAARLDRLRLEALLSALGAASLGALLAWALARQITGRLRLIQATVDEVHAGHQTARCPVVGRDESSSLARGFNRMLDVLEERSAERDRAEEALRTTSQELNAYFQQTLSLFCIADLEGRFRKLNPAWEQVLGYWSAELLDRPFLDFVHPDDRQATIEAMSVLAEGIPVKGFVNRYRHNDGSWRWIEWSSASDGQVIFAAAQDITSRRETEEEIRRLQADLTNIIDSMPSVLAALDATGRVTRWNRAAQRVTGVPPDLAVGQPLVALLPPFAAEITAMHTAVLQTGHEQSRERVFIFQDQERTCWDLMVYPLVAEGRQGTVVRLEDVTERSRIQELMVQTEKMMSLGGLAAGMAHEINNPLGIISQSAQNIERRTRPDLPANQEAARTLGIDLAMVQAYFEARKVPDFIAAIQAAVTRASRIVGNMLQFSRKADVSKAPAHLAEVVEQSLELAANDYDLKKKYDFRSTTITRDFAPDLPPVPMVVVEIEQVILNLVRNAAQAMGANPPDRPPALHLGLQREGPWVVLTIADNGPGMPEAIRRRIFEPFFTTKEPGVGTGLGLSVSYMIITQNHHGRLDVTSTPGCGATFTLRLPCEPEATHD